MAKRITGRLRGTIRNVDDDPYIKLLRFQRKNLEEFGEQLNKLEEIKLEIAENGIERMRDIVNEGIQKIANERINDIINKLHIGQDMSGRQFANLMHNRQWTDESNYIHWINQYYELSSKNINDQRQIKILRGLGGFFIPKRNRLEIVELEERIRGNSIPLADYIRRINTSYYINKYGIHFITINDSLYINERQNRMQNIITEDARYQIQEINKNIARTLSMTKSSFSTASLIFLVAGLPYAAAAATVSLAAAALQVLQKSLSGDTTGAYIEAGFIIASIAISKLGETAINKMLVISTDTKTVYYPLTDRWATIRSQIYRDFGTISGELLSQLIEKLARKVYDEAKKD